MKHIFKQNNPQHPTFILLHGTGGNEKDLIPLAQWIDPLASYLGILGEIDENGHRRFFKRLSEGVFDEADLEIQTDRLHNFIKEAAKKYEFSLSNIVLLGYSNGANMAQSLLFHYPNGYSYAMLLHPMNIKKEQAFADLSQLDVFIGAGLYDPICPTSETDYLVKRLNKANANTQCFYDEAGHQITQNELQEATSWYQKVVLSID